VGAAPGREGTQLRGEDREEADSRPRIQQRKVRRVLEGTGKQVRRGQPVRGGSWTASGRPRSCPKGHL
jgi:hypothetical protein